VIARQIEKMGIPVVLITAMTMMAKQLGVNRIVSGTKIPHPCGDPTLTAEADRDLRREILKCALKALQTDVSSPLVFVPDIKYASG
jgi:betaine reductase